MSDPAIETLFEEDRRYPPPPDFAAQANAKADIYDVPFEEFWEREGRERVTWFEPFTSTSPTTASTATSRRGSAIASRSTTRASPSASARRSRTRSCSRRSCGQPTG